MDEYIDILNEKNESTGKTCLKSFAHKNGIYHASIHVWIFNENKNVLIQKRASNKDTYPNLWDISVAGHISAGEEPLISALREIEEEIGISVSKEQLHFIGNSKKSVHHHQNLIDNELHHIYLCQLEFDIDSIKIQEEEVAAVASIKLNELIEKVTLKNNDFVPRTNNYYNLVFEKIRKFNL